MTKREVEEYIMSQIFPNASHEVTAQNVRNAFAPIVEQVWTYLEGRIGDLSQLQTTDKQSVVNAINYVLSKLNHDITLTKQEIANLGLKVGGLPYATDIEEQGYATGLADDKGNVAFAVDNEGNLRSKRFNSANSPFVETDNSTYAYAIADKNGNIAFAIDDKGNIVSKLFNSANAGQGGGNVQCVDDDSDNLLGVGDANGYLLVQIDKDGNLKTPKFDSQIGSGSMSFDRDLICFGHSIWAYDGKLLQGVVAGGDGTNPTGVGRGVIARGYQTLIREEFNFTSYHREMCLSGHSLGGWSATDNNSIIRHSDSANFWTHSIKSIWLVDTITNDFKRNIPLGTPNDYHNNTGITTYYGALRTLKERIDTYGGDSKIIVGNACRRNNDGYTSTSTNTVGCTLLDYEGALLYVACENNWCFIDQRDCGIKDELINIVTIDGLHLNNIGYNIAVKPWIQALTMLYNTETKTK